MVKRKGCGRKRTVTILRRCFNIGKERLTESLGQAGISTGNLPTAVDTLFVAISSLGSVRRYKLQSSECIEIGHDRS
jgi:hypothetical protein